MSPVQHREVVGTGKGEKTLGWFFMWWHDYDSFLPRRNWHNFTFFNLEFEYAPYMGRFELNGALLGFHFEVTYVYDDTEAKRLMQLSEDIDSGKVKTIPFSDLLK